MSVETKRSPRVFHINRTLVRELGLSWCDYFRNYSRYDSTSDEYTDEAWGSDGSRLLWEQLE
jgi:hypothetical protein